MTGLRDGVMSQFSSSSSSSSFGHTPDGVFPAFIDLYHSL